MSNCTIQILDEVNCRITGLDPQTKSLLQRQFEYEIPSARFMPSVRLGRWNGKTAFFNANGTTYINLLSEIIPILEKRNYQLELDDLRDYSHDMHFDPIREDSFAHIVWPEKHPAAGKPVMLRDYQVTAVNDFLTNRQCIQELATSAGKTLITAAVSLMVQQYGRSIVIVPNKSLVEQTEADYLNLGLDVGVYYGDRKEVNHTHVICTWQSIDIIIKGTALVDINEFLEGVICVIVDETHSAKANKLRSMLCGCMAKIPIRLGLTGTIPPEKIDYTSLITSIGPVTNKLTAKQLQDKKVLSDCHVKILQLQDQREFSNYQAELKFLVEDVSRMEVIAKQILDIKNSGNTLVLVDRIEAGKMLQIMLSSEASLYDQPEVTFVSGKMKQADRKDEYESIATSNNQITIATYGVAAVGINAPRIFNVVLIEPGKSFVRVIQSIGRGIRRTEDKNFVQIYDITSSCKFAKRHLTKRKEFYKNAQYPFDIEKVNYK